MHEDISFAFTPSFITSAEYSNPNGLQAQHASQNSMGKDH